MPTWRRKAMVRKVWPSVVGSLGPELDGAGRTTHATWTAVTGGLVVMGKRHQPNNSVPWSMHFKL